MFCPTSIDRHVLELCRHIHPKNIPVYVCLKPANGSTPHECFVNVRDRVAAECGNIQFGWAIWQDGRFFIEAEHHAVYQPPNSDTWIDITPQESPIERILFLPDETAVYDFGTDQRRDNIRMPLMDDRRVKAYCDFMAERARLINSVPGIGKVSMPTSTYREIQRVEFAAFELRRELEDEYNRKVGRNDPCPCYSGKKFKKCCGRN
jgi:hypothetical protein